MVAGQCLSRPGDLEFRADPVVPLLFLVIGVYLAGFISGAVWVWCLAGKPKVSLPAALSPPRVGVSDFAALSPVR